MFLLKSFLYQTLKSIFHLAVIICVCVCVFPGCVHHQWAGAEVSHPSTDESLLLQHLQRKLKAAERCCFIDSWLRFLFFYILLRCYCVLHLLFVEFHFMSVFTPIKNNIKTSITVCMWSLATLYKYLMILCGCPFFLLFDMNEFNFSLSLISPWIMFKAIVHTYLLYLLLFFKCSFSIVKSPFLLGNNLKLF